MVMEDTCILHEVDYAEVCREIQNCRAGVFGYGQRWHDNGKVGWHGTKAVYMTPDWCEEMSILLANTHLHKFHHADMWLKNLLRCRRAQGFQLLTALGGYGHRIFLTPETLGWSMAASSSTCSSTQPRGDRSSGFG